MEQIGRYHVDGELGKGAMGVVYRATDPNIGRTVALKTMRLDVHGIEAEEMLQRFRNEARSAGVLNHPNIVTIYDAGEADGLFYMAMEVVEGQSLQQLLAAHHVLPVEQVLKLCRQVGEGLDYAHARGVIHRDIKPANIMITTSGLAKIMDFGIAKAGGGLTSTGQVLGTPNYMSPEQVKGKPLDGRTDLFSLGVVLYESLTGEKPFGAENVTTIIYKIVHEEPIAPSELDVSIHPRLSSVISRALAKNPDRRYQSGAELATDLENYKLFASQEEGSESADLAAGRALEGGSNSGAATAVASAPVAAVVAALKPVLETVQAAVPVEIKPKEPKPRVAVAKAAASTAQRSSDNRLLYGGIALLLVVAAVFGFGALRSSGSKAEVVAGPAAATPTTTEENRVTAKSPLAVAASTPAPFAALGAVSVVTTPAGASVKLDGKKLASVTPVTEKNLQPGKHTVQITAPGYFTALKSFDVMANATVIADLTLVPMQGVVKLSSAPAGADVFVDGVASNKKTPAEFSLAKGDHTFAVRMAGYDEAGDLINVVPGQTITFAPTLTASRKMQGNPFKKMGKLFGGDEKGTLSVTTDPEGAYVFINARRVGQTPLNVQMPTGRYFMAIRKPGFAPVQKAVTVEKGKATSVQQAMAAKVE